MIRQRCIPSSGRAGMRLRPELRLRVGGLFVALILGASPSLLLGQSASGDPGQGTESLTLAQAVAMALETHPAVGEADAAGEVAGARVRQARSALLPSLTGQGSMARHQEPMVVAPLHGFDPMHPPSFDRTLVQGAISLGYTLFDGGARGARIGQAEAGERAVEAGGEGARMAVAAQVSAAYLGVLTGEDLLAAVLGQKAALSAELQRVRLFLEEGKAARVDLLRVEAAISRVEAQEISVRSELELARSRVARLTGLEAEAVGKMSFVPVSPVGRVILTRDHALAAAMEGNPELRRAQEVLSGATVGVKEAAASWLPRVEANGRYANFGTLDGGHVQEWQGALQISYPLFTGGARDGERDRAVAEERRAAESLRLAKMNLEDGVESALAAVREAQALREALELAEEQSAEVARIEALALEAGAGVQTDFLRAQAELFQARASLSQARHGEVFAQIELARVKGDLSLEWILENMEMVR
ncbi:MAG: TolC family protein [Gemmatimonadota bacterium]